MRSARISNFPPHPSSGSCRPAPTRPSPPYLGRWEGDDEDGGYYILHALRVGPERLVFRVGLSPAPAYLAHADVSVGDFPFEVDAATGGLVYKLPTKLDGVRLKLNSATELEAVVLTGNYGGTGSHRVIFHKREETPADK